MLTGELDAALFRQQYLAGLPLPRAGRVLKRISGLR